jgi:hypothetical protein
MAKAKRQRRSSIRTMPADRALEALEHLERVEPPAGHEPADPAPADDGAPATTAEREED